MVKAVNPKRLLLAALFLFSLISCKQTPVTYEIRSANVNFDSLALTNYADTIVCDMVVKNPDTTDVWAQECLHGLKREQLTNNLFNAIYTGKLVAYDFYTHKPLSAAEVKKLEKMPGYSRNIVGKYQFREAWLYDSLNHVFLKKVHSITFGFETYAEQGGVKGYKPLFILKF